MAKILLVDDSADNLEIYRTILAHFGYSVRTASNGEEGVRVTRDFQPDIVFMDVSMPVMDGLAATRVLKADPSTAGICVVALTAHALVEDRKRVMDAGCDGYLTKPLEPRELIAEVRRLLGDGA